MGAFLFGTTQRFVEEHSEVSGPNTDGHRIILNLDVSNCRDLEDHLKSQDVTWVREVEQMPFGLIGTLADPDGNLVQVIEWGAAPAEGHGCATRVEWFPGVVATRPSNAWGERCHPPVCECPRRVRRQGGVARA